MSVTWLVSYPKSGNTWVRSFLTNYIDDGDEPADINNLRGGWSYLERANFDEAMGMSSSDMTDDELNYYRPIYHQSVSEVNESPILIKSHEAYRTFPNGSSLFNPVNGCKAVHLVRNPLDVAVSFAHHNDKSIDRIIKKMNNPNSKMSGGAFRFYEYMGRWSDYNDSWMAQNELPVLMLRYEDIVADSEGAFCEIVKFIGLDFDREKIKKANDFSSFDTLKKQEEARGFVERQPTAENFFRKGIAGDWKESLTARQIEKILTDHRAMMEILGYDAEF